ncbi:uncharacterized protein DSM5745_05766 [Aspergillus mulundensis]|uniref:Major facilitator superfamily (MFS) profile domain-containing protein n=1 Tax=Aspergillus mulundensis TaxID=1810919 RepID=A0A3D8RYI0_9EURO|nr:hypothetical protein DSM5745_05766 [Aspergillus mulundensis]RDW78914.1 hypothetical protein DSM5745_05766 [Aspergillus mulundensis]
MSLELQTQDKPSPARSIDDETKPGEVEAIFLPDWSEQEERKVVRLMDCVLLPVLIAANFMVQIDRGNLSNSLTSTITQDLNISTNQVNVASQIFLVGVVIFELPSNILMQIFSPHLWLSAQIFIWGTIATFESFIKTYGSLLATRFLLGLFEAGFEPGGMYLLTMWYKPDEYALRIGYYYMGKLLASALSGLLAAGILNLAGVAGWVEGLMTIFVAFIFFLLLPRNIRNPIPVVSFNRWSYFTKRQRHILLARLGMGLNHTSSASEGESTAHRRGKVSLKELLETFKNIRLWFHVVITMLSACALHGLTLYTPTMIKSFHFSTIHSNALTSVAYFAAIVMCGALTWLSDRTQQRGLVTLLSVSWSLITWGCLMTVAGLSNKWHKYVILILANLCGVTTHVLNTSWLLSHTKSDQERGISSAVMTIAVNLGGLSGGQIYREEYAPTYHHSIQTMTIVGAAAWVVTVALILLYYFTDRERCTGVERHNLRVDLDTREGETAAKSS